MEKLELTLNEFFSQFRKSVTMWEVTLKTAKKPLGNIKSQAAVLRTALRAELPPIALQDCPDAQKALILSIRSILQFEMDTIRQCRADLEATMNTLSNCFENVERSRYNVTGLPHTVGVLAPRLDTLLRFSEDALRFLSWRMSVIRFAVDCMKCEDDASLELLKESFDESILRDCDIRDLMDLTQYLPS